MAKLAISLGQYSDKGRKQANQDFHGALIPEEPLLGLKGIAVVLADGISSSEVGAVASELAVKSFLTDYYCTSDSWSVKTSAQRVIAATNSWLHAQTRQSQYLYDSDRGYVCTLSALVVKSATAHIFHVGDARIYRVAGHSLEQLTEDHRVIVSSQQSFLGRALGVNPQIEIDYDAINIAQGDVFVLATDGVYEHVNGHFIADTIDAGASDLDAAARDDRRRGEPPGQPRQSDRSDRAHRRLARQRGERNPAPGGGAALSAAVGSAHGARRLPHRAGNPREPAAAISIWPSTAPTTHWSPSRRRRSTCVATRPICSAS